MGKYVEEMKLRIDPEDGNTIHGSIDHGNYTDEVALKIFTRLITSDNRLCIITEPIKSKKDIIALDIQPMDAYDNINHAFIDKGAIEAILNLMDKLAGEEACGISEIAIAKTLAEKYGDECGDAYLHLHNARIGLIPEVFYFRHSFNICKTYDINTGADKWVPVNNNNENEPKKENTAEE